MNFLDRTLVTHWESEVTSAKLLQHIHVVCQPCLCLLHETIIHIKVQDRKLVYVEGMKVEVSLGAKIGMGILLHYFNMHSHIIIIEERF